uniref:RRM domain-containing protein n=1 Tax=Anser brachyrhynchus TaxID=132585 RepID=A0A8B9IA05_9AVES
MNSGGIGVPLGFPLGPTSVIQVTNLSSAVTSEQMRTLFGFLGDIEELRDETQPTRFAFVEFADQNSVPRALAFNGVMFGDRPLK